MLHKAALGIIGIIVSAQAQQVVGPANDDVIQSQENITWRKVVDQHGSSIDMPVSIVKCTKENGEYKCKGDDGRVTIIFDTTTEIRPGFPGNDPAGDMNLKRMDCDSWPPAYYVMNEKVASYSCVKGARVRYYLARYTMYGDIRLYIEYPLAQKARWDKAIGRMAASMRQVKRIEVR